MQAYSTLFPQTLAPVTWPNIYKNKEKQLQFENFYLPFGGKLRSDNRSMNLAKLIPWHDFEELYAQKLAGTGMGAPAVSVRVALGSLIIKARFGTSDQETVEQIRDAWAKTSLSVSMRSSRPGP